MPFSFLSGVGSILGGLGGLFGKKKKQPSPRDNIMSQAQGARDAAAEYGFNPLTMLQYGQPGGASPIAGGGTPPLASVQAITGGLEDIGDVVSGDAARRRAADQLQLDLAQIKLDQAQAGVLAMPGIHGVGSGPSPLGRSAAAVPTNGGTAHALRFDMGSDPIAPGREIDVDPVIDSPGVFRINNRGTFGPVWIPGDGEPWGADEALTAGAVGGPQVARNLAKQRIKETADARGDPEKQKELRDKEMKRIFQHPPGWAGVFSRARSIYQ